MKPSALVIDFSRVLIFAKTDVPSLNRHHDKLAVEQPGYRVLEHFELNTELIAGLRAVAGQLPIFLFTDGHLHSLPEIASGLQNIFRGIVSPSEIGYKKTETEAYLTLAYKIGYDPHQLVFVDDSEKNLEAAAAAGLTPVLYQSNAQILSLVQRLAGS